MNFQFLKFNDTTWIQSYKNSDQLWLSDSLNWEKTSLFSFSDYSLLHFLNNSFFVSQHVNTDQLSKFSFLDVLLLKSNFYKTSVRSFYYYFTSDLYVEFFNIYLPLLALFNSNFQDFFSVISHSTPELNLAVSDCFFNYFSFFHLNLQPSSVFDSFTSNMSHFNVDGLVFFFMFSLNVLFIVYFFMSNWSLTWTNVFINHFKRFFYFFFSMSLETRIQLEALGQTVLFVLLYWVFSLLSFDDDQEESIEFIDVYFFYFFSILISFFIFKHAIHYFSFLEASVAEGRNVNYLILQFRNDFLSSFSLMLRFYTLLFRINVYDTLEDFFDSYYIFVGDFDDDEYMNELFFSLNNSLFFTVDNQDDRSFLHEDESDFFSDLYFIYFLLWAKFSYFFFLMAELAARLSLAFYILYLIIFEVHSVNCSYSEDTFLNNKRA